MNTQTIEILLGIAAFMTSTYLGLMVYIKNPKSWTNRIFFFLSLFIDAYIAVNYLSLHPPRPTPESQLFWIRVVMFVCSFIGPTLLLLVHTFPGNKITIKAKYYLPILTLMALSAAFSLLPMVFSSIEYPQGQPIPKPGPGIPVFFLDFVGLFILSFIVLIYKHRKATGLEKTKLFYLLLGVILSFSLMGITTVIFVTVLKTSSFVFLGPIFPIILMSCIAYAIVKYNMFELKVVATEAVTILLSIVLFSKIFSAENVTQASVDVAIFGLSFILGIILIRSVRKEVQQREKLQSLTHELGDANDKLKALDLARAEFISIASHQLRTPPATIKWYLSAVISGDYVQLNSEE
jgi:hypothetical protein